MDGQRDPFDYVLAEALGMMVEDMRERMSNREHVEWRAFYQWRHAMQELEQKKAEQRGRR